MSVVINGTTGIVNNATDLNYTGTLTGGTGVVNLGPAQFYKDASGNVGIGTSSPGGRLDVNGDSVFRGNFGLTTAGFVYSYAGGVNGQVRSGVQFDGNNQQTLFFTAAAERARIDSSGNLLVGTTSVIQSGKLSVAGAICSQNASAGFSANLTTATGDQFYFRTNSGANLAGYITCPTSTTIQYLSISDYRLKDNVVPMSGALGLVLQLKPVTYTWKADGANGQGFIAHELQAVVPDCVGGIKDALNEDGSIKPQGIDTSFLVATLTAAIQEQQALITALTARITALEGTP